MHGTERRRADCSLQKEASRKGDSSTLPLSASHVLTVLGVHCNLTHPLQAPAAVRGARKGSFPAAWPPSWPGWRLVSRRRRAGLPSATEMEEQWVVSVLSSASVGAVQSDTQTLRPLLKRLARTAINSKSSTVAAPTLCLSSAARRAAFWVRRAAARRSLVPAAGGLQAGCGKSTATYAHEQT